jgi:hypothetical protein
MRATANAMMNIPSRPISITDAGATDSMASLPCL